MSDNGGGNYHYNRSLKPLARALRNEMEVFLWKHVLRAGGMRGYRFRRQRPVLNYTADFMCRELRLVIEIDGTSHDSEEAQEHDALKDRDLERAGYRAVRIPHRDVLKELENVRAWISDVMGETEESSLKSADADSPPPKGD